MITNILFFFLLYSILSVNTHTIINIKSYIKSAQLLALY